ncbi:LysR family transcriptional regulator [Crossiella sp. CA-258035]|uniref:LysR family transcriptional regulator n=1 Tax=Crossiella sp. CA-258035 TaxID=2981138 RepID=UPI0024BCFB58|nr:LysR family transcriptional regulator [Crossiella sp. CA-258035]WHT23118.1 LysR family transcriptional regulator [Crossiella sp. CA-258035]
MDLGPQHLRMIDAIASARSISKAAIQLDLTQPAVSTMLRRVESHLGTQLFVRTPGGVTPTPVGAEVATRARAILAGLDDLDLVLAPPREQPDSPVLRIGLQASPLTGRVAGRLGSVLPFARVLLRVDPGCGTLTALLDSGALDLALYLEPDLPPAASRAVRQVLIECEPVYIGVAADGPLAARAELELAELAGQEWVDDPSDSGPWPAYFRQRCAEAGFTPRVTYWCGNWEMAAALVAAGRALGCFFPVDQPREGVVLKPVRGTPLAQRVVLASDHAHLAAARRLRAELGRAYLELVAASPGYARWWDQHPLAHPALPPVGTCRKAG